MRNFSNHILKRPYIGLYSDYAKYVTARITDNPRMLPCLLPNYDHTPRSGKRGMLLHKSTPQLFGNLLSDVIKKRDKITEDENIVFIKAWNEWGEGNYLEPDLKYGTGFLDAIRIVMKEGC